ADEGAIEQAIVEQAIVKYGINPEKPNPVTQ
ncbi:MAG: pyruvate dehydrogenase E1 component, partial [Candidatus Paceibacteria bacterium]